MTAPSWAPPGDRHRRRKAGPDTFTALGYHPNPGPQTELHDLKPYAKGGPFDVLYGGAVFGGKSYGLLMDALHRANTHPDLEVWLIRATYPQLYDSFIGTLERLGFAKALGARWNGTERTLRLPNRSILKFRHARNLADAADMLSAECQYLVVDERTRVDPAVVEALVLRVRSGRVGVPVIGVRSATNPGGPGHSAVKAAFIDPAPLGRQHLPVELPGGVRADRYFLPARIGDNPAGRAADPTYEARLGLLSAEMQAVYRDGDWSRFEGMRFSAFERDTHVVKPFDIPEGVARGRGVDYGSSAPFACIWAAWVADQLVVYREVHEPGLTPAQQGAAILVRETAADRHGVGGHPTWIDPSTFAHDPDHPGTRARTGGQAPPGSIAFRYEESGVPVRRANNDRVAGWSLIDELLQPLPDGRPGLVIFETCPNLIRSLSGAPRCPRDPEDVDDAYTDDHALDAFRYLAMGLARREVGAASTSLASMRARRAPAVQPRTPSNRTSALVPTVRRR